MKRSIIQDDDISNHQNRKQHIDKPPLKEFTIRRAAILEWRKNFIATFCSNYIRSFIFLAAYFSVNFFTSERTTLFAVYVRINPRLVDIYPVFKWCFLYRFFIFQPFFFAALFIDFRFF